MPLAMFIVANMSLLILFSGTLFYVVHIFLIHILSHFQMISMLPASVSVLMIVKKISLLLLLLVFVALLKSASVVHWSRQSSIVARPLHLRDKYIKQTPPGGCYFGDHSHVYTWWINIKTNSVLWI